MAKKKKKKFQQSQLLALFRAKNYQKVISKVKQFEIEGMDEDELNKILIDSYVYLAENNFNQGDIVRAIRDIDSLLKIDNTISIRVIKLKYLCYIENFKEAVALAEELLSLKPPSKTKKEIAFLYLMANLYNSNYNLDKKLLKTLSTSKQNYILGFCEFLQDNKTLALAYFEKSKPKAKAEKENLEAIKSIISNENMNYLDDEIKAFYHFLLTGDDEGVANSKSLRDAKKELGEAFKSREKNAALKALIELKEPTSIEVILKEKLNKEQESKLIYNNIVLLVDTEEYSEALKIFVKHKNSLINFIESALLFINIKNHIEDRKSDKFILGFFANYLKLHHKKIAPFQIDMMLMFLINNNHIKESINLAKEYQREDFVFLLKELPLMTTFDPHMKTSFNKIMKRYSPINNTLLMFNTLGIEEAAKEFHDLNHREKEAILKSISNLMKLLDEPEKTHKKYKSTLFKLLKALAMMIQSFSYEHEKTRYLELSTLIEQYVEYFKVSRVDLAIDIKALFVSISKEESVRVESYVEEELSEFQKHLHSIFGDDDFEEKKNKYDFNEKEYDLSLLKKACIDNLEAGIKEPFKPLIGFETYTYYRFIHEFMMDLIAKAVEFSRADINKTIDELLHTLHIDMSQSAFRDEFPVKLKEYAKKDIKIAILYFNHAIISVNSSKRESVWYLKWTDAYINMVEDYDLEKDEFFHMLLNHFFKIQNKKKFKSINAKYKKNLKKFKNIQKEGVLF